jgi:hypothetical protein
MKLRVASVLVVCLTLAAVPAAAQTLYSNGPTNGNTDAWPINFGYTVSDTFNVSANSNITGATFAMWLFPLGDTLESANLSITSDEYGGTTYYNQTVNFYQSGCVTNSYGYDVCQESTTNFSTTLANAGTYWLNLTDASTAGHDAVYWDENSGPSLASTNQTGTIASESFTLLGTGATTTGMVSEPSSMVLFASGFFGVTAMLRRKLF